MTRGEMKEAIRYAIGLREPEEQTMIDKQIHLGICDVLRRTSCFVQCVDADVPDDADRIEFAAPGPVMKALHVLRGSVRLERVTFLALRAGLPNCFAQTGQILHFSDLFAPGEKLQLYAVCRPVAMIADGDAIEDEQWGGIPEEFQDAVELYACSKLASRADDSTSGMGGSYWVQYVGQDGRSGRIAEIRRMVNRMSGQTLGPAQLLLGYDGMAGNGNNGNGNGGNGSTGYILPTNDLMARIREVRERTRA